MKTVHVIFRDGENYGEQHAIGWYESKPVADAAAVIMEWDHYRSEAAIQNSDVKLSSPDETEYRRFIVEAVHRLG
ncbi:hypothetical protein ACTAB0_18015 [Pseudomonas syringae]|uniref:hypothetical protein n=1 Tax=Pseudomonas syringae TaxID=317 RepID=UPI003F798DF9